MCEAFSLLLFVPEKIYCKVRNIFDGRHAPGHYKKNIGNFVKVSHTLAR